MNLIQIQEHLKDLPTQAIMAYANGQNPQVPPYMALGEMNRRKSMEQRAAQAPDSSVKEKLESELNQQIALPGVGQGMNMRINPEGMPQPMPAAQPQMAPKMPGMPIQPAARPMPPQQMAQPGAIPAGAPGMAGGGLAELPVRKDIFNYAPGGIVAFADESNEQLVLPPGTPADPNETGTYSESQQAGIDKLPASLAYKILADRLSGNVNLSAPSSKEDIRKKMAAENPEYAAILNKIPGEALGKLATELESQNAAQRARFQEGEGRQGLAALSNALIAAGEATRGQKGAGLGSAFGGFGRAYNASTQAAEERAAKQQALERAQTIETMKLQADIEQMKRAFAEGRVDEGVRLQDQINARKDKITEMQGAAAKEVLDTSEKQALRAAQEARYKGQEAHEQRMYEQAKRSADIAAASKPTGEEKLLTKIQTAVNGDKAYQTLAKKLENVELNSDEYYQILENMREIALTHYPVDGKVKPPPPVRRLAGPTPEPKKGWFGDTINTVPGAKSNSSAVPFSQLPQ